MITSRASPAQAIILVGTWLMMVVVFFFAHVETVAALDYRAEHSIPAQSFQAHFDQNSSDGYYLVSITGFDDPNGNVFFNTIWHLNTQSIAWKGYAGIPQSNYQAIFDENLAQGFRPIHVDGYSARGISYICAIYHLDDGSASWTSRSSQSSSQYQQHFNNMLSQGFSLDTLSSYQNSNGFLRIASLFSKQSTNGYAWAARHGLTASAYQDAFDDLVGQGYSLQHVSVGTIDNGEPRFAAIFSKRPTIGKFRAFHGVTQADFPTRLNTEVSQGYIPKVIDCYRSGIDVRWALLFVEEDKEQLLNPQPNDATFPETACFDEKIASFMKRNIIPGTGVSVMKNGKIVYSQGYGIRDVPGISGAHASSRKVTECTPFRVASVSKPVTSLTILRLVQRGSLTLPDKVFGSGGILQRLSDNPKPCCPIADNRIFDITVYHLLTHSGGWNRDTTFDPMFRSKTIAATLGIQGPASCESVIYYMFGQSLQHSPGATYAYSNFGYCLLGRIIEETTGLVYEEAVRRLLLDPAGISRNEMYIGSTRLEDIPEIESEYYCSDCSHAASVFPTDMGLVPNPYGAWHLEAMDSHGGWVASAPQLMKMLSTTSAPHCNGTIVNGNTEQCLLWESSIDELVKRPSFSGGTSWYGLGFSVRNAGTDQNWWHTGSLPGTQTVMVRTNAGYGYAWTILVNTRGFSDSIDSLMWDAVRCVGNNWPNAYSTTCDISTTPRPNSPVNSPSNAPVDIPTLPATPITPPTTPPVTGPPSPLPSPSPIPISNEPTAPPSNRPATNPPSPVPSPSLILISNEPTYTSPFNVPFDVIPIPNPTTAFPTETRVTASTNEPSASPPSGASRSSSRWPVGAALFVLSLVAFMLP